MYLAVALYGSESWTLKANDSDKLKAFDMTCYRRTLRISWTGHRINESVMNEIGADRELVTTARKRKLHVLVAHDQSTEPLYVHF